MITKIPYALSLMLLISLNLLAERSITGKVLAKETKEPLVGAVLILEYDRETGVTTDFEGFFELKIPEGKVNLLVSYIGFEEKKVEVKPDQKEIIIELEPEAAILSEVTITTATRSDNRKERKKGRKYKSESLSGEGKSMDKPVSYSWDVSDGDGVEEPVRTSAPPPPKMVKEVSTRPYAFVDIPDEVETISEMEVGETKTMVVTDISGSSSFEHPGTASLDLPEAGQLTAGVLNDFGKWNLWQDITENELMDWQMKWGIHPTQRYTLQLTTQNGYPIVDAEAVLYSGSKKIWKSKTDNTGKAELWPNMYDEMSEGKYSIKVNYQGRKYDIENVKDFHEGINIQKLPVKCTMPGKVDIAFVVDATGSMGDEINYLKSELKDVIDRAKKELKNQELRLGSVFYRDHGDSYVTRKSHFSKDIEKTTDFINKQGAAGGGDKPEAVEEALDVALDELVWSDEASARLLFLVLDAPPHMTDEINKRLHRQISKAAEKGIRLIPVACSGTDRSTEYLMRSFCLATNGSYIYLTDDSGIGGSHLKPITDEHKVDLLNDILVQTITDFATTVSCDEQLEEVFTDEQVQDTTFVEMVVKERDEEDPDKIIETKEFAWKYYPNPTAGNVNVELEGELDFMYLMDGAGKLLRRIEVSDPNFQIRLGEFPSGIYYLKGIGKNEKEVTGKVVLIRP